MKFTKSTFFNLMKDEPKVYVDGYQFNLIEYGVICGVYKQDGLWYVTHVDTGFGMSQYGTKTRKEAIEHTISRIESVGAEVFKSLVSSAEAYVEGIN